MSAFRRALHELSHALTRRAALPLALVALAVAFFAVPPKATPGPIMRDFEAYYAAGSSRLIGDDPYSRELWRAERRVPGVNPSRDELLPFVGPPFGLPLWASIARLPYPRAAFVWGVVLGVAFATLALGSIALAGRHVALVDALAALALGASFGPITSGIALGQPAVVAGAAIVATLLLLRANRTLPAATAATVAMLQPNIAIALFAARPARRTAIVVALAATVAIGGSALEAGGVAQFSAYVDGVRAHAAAEEFLAIQITTGAIARSLGATVPLARTIALAIAAAVLVALAVQLLSKHYDALGRVSLACAAIPLVLPFAHEHDLAIAFLPAVACLRRASGIRRAGCIAATACIAVDWLGLAQRPTGIAATASLSLAVALAAYALASRDGERLGNSAIVALALVPAAVACAGAFAAAHPLAVWPDRLPLSFHVPPQIGPAETWRREQAASGVAALDPAWGFLRAIALGGCAALWAVAAVVLKRPASETRAATA